MEQEQNREDEKVLNAIIIACIIGIVIVIGLILFYPRPSEDFTALYFTNSSQYTKVPIDGKVYFNFTIENHENKDMSYLIEYQIDNLTVSQENVSIAKDMNMNLGKSIRLKDNTTHKIGILLNSDSDYEIHFWTIS